MVLSLAKKLEVNPAAAILHQFQRNDGDDSELSHVVEMMKESEESTRWVLMIIVYMLLLDYSPPNGVYTCCSVFTSTALCMYMYMTWIEGSILLVWWYLMTVHTCTFFFNGLGKILTCATPCTYMHWGFHVPTAPYSQWTWEYLTSLLLEVCWHRACMIEQSICLVLLKLVFILFIIITSNKKDFIEISKM